MPESGEAVPDEGGGSIREGGAADLVLFDDQTPYTVEKFHSKASKLSVCGSEALWKGSLYHLQR